MNSDWTIECTCKQNQTWEKLNEEHGGFPVSQQLRNKTVKSKSSFYKMGYVSTKTIIFGTATMHETVWLTICKTSRLMNIMKFLALKSMQPLDLGLFCCFFLIWLVDFCFVFFWESYSYLDLLGTHLTFRPDTFMSIRTTGAAIPLIHTHLPSCLLSKNAIMSRHNYESVHSEKN